MSKTLIFVSGMIFGVVLIGAILRRAGWTGKFEFYVKGGEADNETD